MLIFLPTWLFLDGCRRSPVDDTQLPPESCPTVSATTTPTHLITISVDTLRRDKVGAFGSAVSTPNIDRLLTQGVSFDQHQSCSSWTLPSFLCALTGSSLFDLGLWPEKGDTLPDRIPDDVVLLSETLQNAGYYTILAGGSGFLGAASGMAQGYDAGESFFYDQDPRFPKHDYLDNHHVLAAGLQLLDERPAKQPAYAHFHFQQVHAPYNVADKSTLTDDCVGAKGIPYDLSTKEGTVALWRDYQTLSEPQQQTCLTALSAHYDQALIETDAAIGDLLDGLEERALLQDALVLFFADHGEELAEHGNFDHGKSAFEEVTAGVAALYGPGLDPQPMGCLTTHQDLAPMALHLLGLADPHVPAHPALHTLTTMSNSRTRQSVSDGQYKLIGRWDCDDADGGPWWFFDLEKDPKETKNLFGDPDYTQIANDLWDQMRPKIDIVNKDPEQTFQCPLKWG